MSPLFADFRSLGSLRDHTQPASFPRRSTQSPRERRVLPGSRNSGSERSAMCPESHWNDAPVPCHIPAPNPPWLPGASAQLPGHRVVSGRPEGLGTVPGGGAGGLASQAPALQTSHRLPGRQRFPKPPVHVHVFTFLATTHSCESFCRCRVKKEGSLRWPWQRVEFLKQTWPTFC